MTNKFIKATEPVSVELNEKTYLVKPISFRAYIKIQQELRNSFSEEKPQDVREQAYIDAITELAVALKLPVDEVLDSDMEFINRLIEVFLLQTK